MGKCSASRTPPSMDDQRAPKRLRPLCVVPPDPHPLLQFAKLGLFSTLLLVFSPYLAYIGFKKKNNVLDVWAMSRRPSVKNDPEYQEPSLIDSFWSTSVGRIYIDAVEYQLREGYCGPATLRCILKTLIPLGKLKMEEIPDATSGPMTAKAFALKMDQSSRGQTSSSVVLGSEGYQTFKAAIKLSNDPGHRVAINFLRSPLFGSPGLVLLPANFMKVFFGGHFSVIVGFDEKKDLVAVFDVNHTYGGLYLINSKRLFESINTFDLQSGEERGLVVVKIQ